VVVHNTQATPAKLPTSNLQLKFPPKFDVLLHLGDALAIYSYKLSPNFFLRPWGCTCTPGSPAMPMHWAACSYPDDVSVLYSYEDKFTELDTKNQQFQEEFRQKSNEQRDTITLYTKTLEQRGVCCLHIPYSLEL